MEAWQVPREMKDMAALRGVSDINRASRAVVALKLGAVSKAAPPTVAWRFRRLNRSSGID